MDLEELRTRAAAITGPAAAAFHAATAGDEVGVDEKAWQSVELVPRVLRGLASVSTSTSMGDTDLGTPVMVAATAAHGLCHPNGEPEMARGAAAAGALYCYSSSATVEVSTFGADAPGPWWAQVYVMTDRGRTWDYVDRAVAAGAGALVLTVDNPGPLGDAPFRRSVQAALPITPGNFPGWTWSMMSASIEPTLTPDLIGELADRTGRPVWVKGVVHRRDVEPVVQAGGAGIIVSTHGRRQLAGVIPTAAALPAVIDAAAGRLPVHVDGGIRSGTDVLRALELGATGVGLGRPALWALATGGATGVTALIDQFTGQLRQGMAAMGAATIKDLGRG